MNLVPTHTSLLESSLNEERVSPILAQNVKRLRKRAKINKQTFALMVGVGRPFLNKIENGLANPRLSVIVKMADALETTPDYLLTSHEDDHENAPHAGFNNSERLDAARHARLL